MLTSVGLDHTQWLGETLEQIAAEKLAVLRDHTTLIHGQLAGAGEPVVERAVERHHATAIEPELAAGAGALPPGYQRDNLALAMAAVETRARPARPRPRPGGDRRAARSRGAPS